MEKFEINDQILTCYIDQELDAATAQQVTEAMEVYPDVRDRVTYLRRSKDLLKLGFGSEKSPSSNPHRDTATKPTQDHRKLLACAMTFLLLVTGFFSYQAGKHVPVQTENQISQMGNEGNRLILHISESNPEHFLVALQYASRYAEERESTGGEVVVIANAGGIEFLRKDVSPFVGEVTRIMRDRRNIHFIACAAAASKLRMEGLKPVFIEQVDASEPALDHIIRFARDGWEYKKVGDLVQEL